ncbi:malonyl-CoA decarboxylase, mitochondrial-like isoform X1 [Amphibalanus amphitrite]|uniref:malonyl-CoA decarboxylase, mitochondrial-like isoform X1 n=1 Tax=Amphibalanus amphitrite TaxID=1232801 RepID=UPI001C9171A2|nr:malonyl-CoA decarboxylase, mitochondrial-like isoform X1 [Amphibalanus amphitrite]
MMNIAVPQLSGMIVSGCSPIQLLVLRAPRLVPGRSAALAPPAACRPLSSGRRRAAMAAFRSQSRPTPGVRVPSERAEPVHLASPSAENLLLFSESPTAGWLACRGLSGPPNDDPPAIVLTPAEPPPPAEGDAEQETPSEETPQPPQPPPLPPLVGYLQDTLRGLVTARNENKPPHTLEVLSRRVVAAYGELAPSEHQHFFRLLADEHSVDHSKVLAAAAELAGTQGGAQILKREEGLASLLQPDYVWIFKQLGRTEGGVKFLVDMRAHLLRTLTVTDASDPSVPRLRSLGSALKDLIALWFSVGFLQLERITWESPCAMLEKVSEYEAVHPVRNWTDLKRRVGPYRRCFVFTHHAMPSEPVVVLHTALTPTISSSIQDIVRKPRRFSLSDYLHGGSNDAVLKDEDPGQIAAAIFYSISSTQKGLQGIELGNYLIKRVVRELAAEYPQLSQFSSLSPIPGFKSWLTTEINKAERGQCRLLTDSELARLAELTECQEGTSGTMAQLRRLVTSCSWLEEGGELCQLLEAPLMRLCARYLYSEKRRGSALDSVANFHLRNGAVMWRLNWRADLTARGLTNSCGIMVNYRYFLEDTQQNSERYLSAHTITASEGVRQLADRARELGRTDTVQ